MSQYLLAGTIKKTKGLTGELKIKFEKDFKYKINNTTAFYINTGGATYIPYLIEKMSATDDLDATIKFKGINTLEAANALAGKNIYTEEKLLMTKSTKRERAWETLEGYLLYDKNTEIGKIEGVYSMPAQYIAAVLYKDKEVLVPLFQAFITDIDDEKKHIYMQLPEGLWDVYTDNDIITPDAD